MVYLLSLFMSIISFSSCPGSAERESKKGCEEMIYIFSQSFSYFCMFFSSRRFIRESPASLTISF